MSEDVKFLMESPYKPDSKEDKEWASVLKGKEDEIEFLAAAEEELTREKLIKTLSELKAEIERLENILYPTEEKSTKLIKCSYVKC